MKQLKFMLAAATAVGFAAAAQAASLSNTPLVNDTFDGATLPAGYSYDGDVEADNESAVEEGVLKVNTGTDPLLRALDFGESAREVNLADEKFDSLVIDTMVQFTVTPAGDEVKPSKDADGNILDKIMIYLAEATNETGVVIGTNLMVKAAKYTPATTRPQAPAVFEESDVVASGVSVVPGAWYHLVVTSKKHEDGFAQFKIQLAAEGGELVPLTNSEGLINTDNTLFPSLTGIDGVNPTTLTYVGFAGEGKVDDLKVNLFELATSVDFTFKLGDNVSAVSWTVDGDEQDSLTYSAAAGSTYDVVIKSVTYAPGYAGSTAWAGWKSTVTASTTVTIDGAEKFAEVAEDNEGNVTAVIPNETTVANITTGSFKVPEDGSEAAVVAAKAELGKVLTWATSVGCKSYSQAIAAVNKMNFDSDGNPAVFGEDDDVADEEAFLLNCAPAELAAAKEAFSFPSFTPGEIPQATEGDFNGKVTLKGATALGSWFDVIKEQGENYGKIFNGKTFEVPSFFKSVLTLK